MEKFNHVFYFILELMETCIGMVMIPLFLFVYNSIQLAHIAFECHIYRVPRNLL